MLSILVESEQENREHEQDNAKKKKTKNLYPCFEPDRAYKIAVN